jgi:hypothetical protein
MFAPPLHRRLHDFKSLRRVTLHYLELWRLLSRLREGFGKMCRILPIFSAVKLTLMHSYMFSVL